MVRVYSEFICLHAIAYVSSYRVPFYYLIKTVLLLYLALPQTQGSSYLYIYHLQPFFHNHEAQIDATLATLKARAVTFIQEKLQMVWQQMLGQQPAPVSAPPPSLSNPAEGPAHLVSSLWASFGPSVIASGAALLKQATSTVPAGTAPAYSRSSSSSDPVAQSVLERRRQLEAELAALSAGGDRNSVPMPTGSPSFSHTSSSPNIDFHMRDRTTSVAGSSTGQFEEIQAYDVGQEDEGQGHAYDPNAQQKKGWFNSWVTPGPAPYDRLKDE